MIIIDTKKPNECSICPCFNGEFASCNLLNRGVNTHNSGIDKECPIKDLKTMIHNTHVELEKEVNKVNTYSYYEVKKVGSYKVKRCPFCGHRPSYEIKIEGSTITSKIYCINASCWVKASTRYTYNYRTAVNVWNTRKRGYNNAND